MMVFAMVLCRVMWPNQDSLRRFTVANRGSCFPARSPLVVSHSHLSCVRYAKCMMHLLMGVFWFVLLTSILLFSELTSIPCIFFQSGSEVLKFTVAASHELLRYIKDVLAVTLVYAFLSVVTLL